MNFLFYAPQMAAYGGMERHICSLAAACCAAGHTVELITTSNSLGAELRASMQHPRLTLRELPVARGRASGARKAWWLLRQTLAARVRHWDVIYTNGQSGLARLVWLAAGKRTRVVHHHHTAADEKEQATWSDGFRKVLKTAPELVGCSRATQQQLARALSRSNVHFLPYLTAAPAAGGWIPEQRPKPAHERLHFGFLGRLVVEKGIDRICALSQRPELADISWHIHGAGADYPPKFFASYRNVLYHGAFSAGPQLQRILQDLDATVLFSTHNEGMPLSLIEAMSAGLPWIATDRGGTRELALSPANCQVIPPNGTLESDAAAVRSLADRIRSGTTSRAEQYFAYAAHFSPQTVSAVWSTFFETPGALSPGQGGGDSKVPALTPAACTASKSN
ncbi:MAG: glycosyltransferase family 4 protein [Verrucomicrobiota bacterium]